MAVCGCVRFHRPRPVVIEQHHVVPLSWGGLNVKENKIGVCATTHYDTHSLLNEYVRHGGKPPSLVLKKYSRFVKKLAASAWSGKPVDHKTPFWLPAHKSSVSAPKVAE